MPIAWSMDSVSPLIFTVVVIVLVIILYILSRNWKKIDKLLIVYFTHIYKPDINVWRISCFVVVFFIYDSIATSIDEFNLYFIILAILTVVLLVGTGAVGLLF